ncbi:ABL099Wp [Eremothecium gossypii ATCC 10895]|uniref:ABL099Wp n=1 Tax=Eremothecium gossypii (strain ATCC 10895 / CBS 109.51 / FGSC 9923 / NRRL Y-1056) TaxID=284811 RepID=Q75DX2_EREGS|nr:ABL099Wp [Eremothecium gossypii ATCC 10895]AAS50672.1 ABL099Wp [Eremothecium gossypii ATCC 10895]
MIKEAERDIDLTAAVKNNPSNAYDMSKQTRSSTKLLNMSDTAASGSGKSADSNTPQKFGSDPEPGYSGSATDLQLLSSPELVLDELSNSFRVAGIVSAGARTISAASSVDHVNMATNAPPEEGRDNKYDEVSAINSSNDLQLSLLGNNEYYEVPRPSGNRKVYSQLPSPPDTKASIKKASAVGDPKRTKRKYSRNGCTECKRRRMKCDEGKPICWQCSRLNRECKYILNARNKKRAAAKKQQPEYNVNDYRTTLEKPVPSAQFQLNSFTNSLPISNHPAVNTPDEAIIYSDVNLLLQNFNDIVNMKLNDSLFNCGTLNDDSLHDLDLSTTFHTSAEIPKVLLSDYGDTSVEFNTSLESFHLGPFHEKYLTVFYHDCLNTIAPFFEGQTNPLRDILLSFAKTEPYLLSAILAVGASARYRKFGCEDDEKAYCNYLSQCLSLLDDHYSEESKLMSKIAPIMLTVILLAWDSVYTMNSQWRSHLKGVTDLLRKTDSIPSTKVLNVVKCWFKVIETFAGISTVIGGALLDDGELDAIFDPYNNAYLAALKQLSIMTPLHEFNLLRGHKEDFDLVIKEVFKALNSIRASDKGDTFKKEGIMGKSFDYLQWSSMIPPAMRERLSYLRIQKILTDIDSQLSYKFIDNSGIIPISNCSHPENSHIVDNAIDTVVLNDGKTIAISWYDISHQTQVLSFLLIVLLKLLGIPKQSIVIQDVVRRITGFFSFLDSPDPPKNLRSCYCNFAILIAGLNSIEQETQDIIRKYYRAFGGQSHTLMKYNLERLEQVWRLQGTEDASSIEDKDIITW